MRYFQAPKKGWCKQSSEQCNRPLRQAPVDQPFHVRTPWKSWSAQEVEHFFESRCGNFHFIRGGIQITGADLGSINTQQLSQLGIKDSADQQAILRSIRELTGGFSKKFTPQKRAHRPQKPRQHTFSHRRRQEMLQPRKKSQSSRPEWKNPSGHRHGIKNRETADAWGQIPQLRDKPPASYFIKHPRSLSIVAQKVGAHRLFETKPHVRTGGNSFTVSECKPDTGHYAVYNQPNADFPNTQPPIVVNGTVGKIMQTFGV
jgi:hypothetical protein